MLRGEENTRSLNIMTFAASLVSILPLIGGMFPYGFPMFSPIVIFFCCMVIILKNERIRFGQWISAYFILTLTYVFPLVISGNIYSPNYYDLINIVVFFAFFLVLTNVIEYREDFEKYTFYFQFLTAITSIGFAIVGLYKFMLLLNNIKISLFYRDIGTYPWGTSLVSDYNVYGLSMLFGLVSMCFLFEQRKKVWEKFFIVFGGAIVFSAAAFSGSRRSWIILPFILILAVKIAFRGSFSSVVICRIKRSQLINVLVVLLVFLSATAMYGVMKYRGFRHEFSQKHYLSSMWNRFVGTRDVVGTQKTAASRSEHYAFAGEILEEYSLLRVIIGNGGEYMKQYGLQFNAKDGLSKPHNPLISALLQSGVLGGIVAVGYLTLCFILYLKHGKHQSTQYFLLLFLITSFFSLSSSNTIFSKKVFIFIFLLPWLINDIYYRRELLSNID